MILYRGISVAKENAEKIISTIKKDGLSASSPGKKYSINSIKYDLDSIPALSREFTVIKEDQYPCTFFGDFHCASYYALIHNHEPNNVAIIISADIEVKALSIDGRDFLYKIANIKDTIVQDGDIYNSFIKIYGTSIIPYLNR